MTKQLWKTNQVINFAEFVEYADGSIVSKTLFDKEAGSLTLFAFGEGQGITEHESPFDATVQVLDGKGKFIVGGEEYIIKAGEGMIMPANIPHAVKADSKFKMLLIMIRQKAL